MLVNVQIHPVAHQYYAHLLENGVLKEDNLLYGSKSIQFHVFLFLGKMIICPAMNINLLFVGGASIFAKFLS